MRVDSTVTVISAECTASAVYSKYCVGTNASADPSAVVMSKVSVKASAADETSGCSERLVKWSLERPGAMCAMSTTETECVASVAWYDAVHLNLSRSATYSAYLRSFPYDTSIWHNGKTR